MAKKPIRIYRRAEGRTASTPVPVYQNGTDNDRLSITQQVLDYPDAHFTRSKEGGDSKYQELLHTIYDAVMIMDQDGQIIDVNSRAEHNFLWSREDLCEMNIVDMISGADDELLKLVRKNVTNKKFTVLEAICIRGDDTRFHAEIVINRFKDDNKKNLCFFIRDVTARKEAENELLMANDKLLEAEKVQARVDTLSTLFYELNNPLQILTCMAELDENKEYKKQIGRIVAVLEQLRKQEAIEPIVDDEGSTRFSIEVEKDLLECDVRKLLVVDDERVLREMFVKALGQAFPYLTIEVAENGQAAVDAFREGRHGLIIMDVSMPVMNGEDAFAEIQRICDKDALKMPRLIFCTGFVISDHLKEIIGDGSLHACVSKPLTITDLVESVRVHLARQSVS